ncbi:MAG: hypothetical protein ABNH26_00065 [Celeribacter sp.]
MTFVAEKLDRELSSSALAPALPDALSAVKEGPLSPVILLSAALPELVAGNALQSEDAALADWLGMPPEILMQWRTAGASVAAPGREAAKISQEEFFEVLKSSPEGIMFLQGAMALNKT